MLRCIIQELKKNFYLPYVLLPIVSITCLCLATTAEMTETGGVSIFSLMVQNWTEGTVMQIEKSALYLWDNGLGGWLQLFLPLLLTYGYITHLSEERQSGQIMFQLLRCGNFRYCVSKVVSGALFGGFLLTAGYGLFGILMTSSFPLFSSFPLEQQSSYLEYYYGNIICLYVLKRLAGVFLYGMFSSVFGIGAAVFLRDKYMLLCFPFLLSYMYEQVLQKIRFDWMSSGTGSTAWLNALRPNMITYLSLDQYWAVSVLLMFSLYIGLTVLFYVIVKKGHYGG